MKNRQLIFFVSAIVTGILFSFSMLCFASLQNSKVSAKSGYSESHSLTEKSTGKKKAGREFNTVKTAFSKTIKIKSNFVSGIFGFNHSLYNSYYEGRNLITVITGTPVSLLEEISSVRLII